MERLNSNPVPFYFQIAEILRKEFLSKYQPGDRVASEPELITRFGVSRTTVRQALALLEREGLVVRRPAKGTFLAQPKIEPELSGLTGFVEDMNALGLEASARVVSIKTVRPGPPVTDRLALPPDASVVRIERVRLANGKPMSFDVTYLPPELGEKVVRSDLVVHPIFSLLEDLHGVALGEADYRIEATSADRRVAQLLEIAPAAPILLIERTSYAISGAPVDYEKLHYRADHIRYRMRLKRQHPIPRDRGDGADARPGVAGDPESPSAEP